MCTTPREIEKLRAERGIGAEVVVVAAVGRPIRLFRDGERFGNGSIRRSRHGGPGELAVVVAV
jgi:hypothetical protein